MFITPDQLFIESLKDLRKRLRGKGEYDLLRASAICRQLLLDGGQTLIHTVNRHRKIDILFTVSEESQNPRFLAMPFSWVSVSPFRKPKPSDYFPYVSGKKVQVPLQTFLGTKVLRVNAHIYTVSNIIKDAANYMGGVHKGSPNGAKERVLDGIERLTQGDHQTMKIALTAICQVVLKSLVPLEKQIISEVGRSEKT